MHVLFKVITALAVCCLPLYLFRSGGLQISHLLIVIAFAVLVINRSFYLKVHLVQKLVLILFVYSFFVEATSVLLGGPEKSLFSAFHILFSFFSVAVFMVFIESDREFRLLKYAFYLSGLVGLMGVFVVGVSLTTDTAGGRSVGTFNNPNQLGYFSVCYSCILCLLRYEKKVSSFVFWCFMGVAVFLAIASLSKAAMVSIILVLLLASFVFLRSRAELLIGGGIAITLVFYICYLYWDGFFDQLRFIQRLEGIGTGNDDSAEERGYYLIFEAEWYELLFGMGLTKVKELVGHEVHSTIYSFFANYGMLGGVIFVIVLAIWAWGIFRSYGFLAVLLICGAPMAYGLTHNGSRFTIFWLLISFSLAVSHKKNSLKRVTFDEAKLSKGEVVDG